MEWLVRLEGENWSLQDLPGWFSHLDHKVRRLEDGKYYLTSLTFAHCTSPSEVFELGAQIVAWLNGAARAFEKTFYSVQVGSEIVQVDDAGVRRVHQHLRPATREARIKAHAAIALIDGKPTTSQPSRPEELLALLVKSSATSSVPRVLDAWLLPTTWQRLRYVCDAIRENVAPDTDIKRSWETMAREMAPMVGMDEPRLNTTLRRFNKTAAKPEHAGSSALHGYMTGPIADPMPLPEAEGFIHDLLVAWLSRKIDNKAL
jgi:hypothetical protein